MKAALALPAVLLAPLLLTLPLGGCERAMMADCRALGLDNGWGTCVPPDVPPPPPPYCTRTLGRVECWSNPGALPSRPPGVADGPAMHPPPSLPASPSAPASPTPLHTAAPHMAALP